MILVVILHEINSYILVVIIAWFHEKFAEGHSEMVKIERQRCTNGTFLERNSLSQNRLISPGQLSILRALSTGKTHGYRISTAP